MSNKRIPDVEYTAPQVSLTGRNAWVVLELQRARGSASPAEPAAWIIDQWIGGEGRKRLLDEYGIDIRKYRASSVVVPIDRKKGG
jgi:hypothetical protein